MPNAAWEAEVDHSTPAAWSEMLDLFRDANMYQTWSYGRVRWGEENLSHLVLRRNGEVVGMAQLRIVRPTRLNFGIAYMRWGPLCERRSTPLDLEVVRRFAHVLEEEYIGKRRLFLLILPNAFIGSARAAAFQSAFGRFMHESRAAANTYRTLVLDLGPSLEELRKRLDKKWRNQLSRAERNDLKVIVGNGIDEYRTFCRMYREMRARKTFESTVDVEEFERIQKDLPEPHRLRTLICEKHGVPMAGLVSSAMGDSAIYLLGATSDEGLNSRGSYLLQWTLIKWLKENGFKWYDLGGINPERNPRVYHFKAGLSGSDLSHVDPLVACDSFINSAIVRAGLAMYKGLRASMTGLRLALAREVAGKSERQA